MTQYEALLACYRSGQMNYTQLRQHMFEDSLFAAYVHQKCGK